MLCLASRTSSGFHSRAPSVAPAEAEHFDISNAVPPEEVIIDQGEVVLPTIECATEVDQLCEFWTSISLPTPRTDRSRPDLNIPEPASPIAPPTVNSDARDFKIAELQKQLPDLERRTKPTRTPPEGSHHSGIDFTKSNMEPKKNDHQAGHRDHPSSRAGATRTLRVRDA